MKSQYENLHKWLSENSIEFKLNTKLSGYTYLRTGGSAAFVIQPNRVKQLQTCLSYLKINNISFKVVGYTSNLLFLDDIKCLRFESWWIEIRERN